MSRHAIEATTPLWSQLESLVDGIHGWSPIDQLYTLYTLVVASADVDGDVLEVGSWCGRSAVVLAAACRASGEARVRCVDLFPKKSDWKQNADGSYSFQTTIDGKTYSGYQEQTVWKEAFETQTNRIYDQYDGVLDCFNEVVAARGYTDIVEAHRGDLASFLQRAPLTFRCRLAFLDGDHGYEAVREDIRNVDACLMPGGWICFDDAFTTYEGVNKAISELILDNGNYECCQQMTRKLFIARKRRDVRLQGQGESR